MDKAIRWVRVMQCRSPGVRSRFAAGREHFLVIADYSSSPLFPSVVPALTLKYAPFHSNRDRHGEADDGTSQGRLSEEAGLPGSVPAGCPPTDCAKTFIARARRPGSFAPGR